MLTLQSFIEDFRRFKILIASDDGSYRRSLRNMLGTLGFSSFSEAEDGDDALRKLRAREVNFIFCDWEMPLVNGPDLIKALRDDQGLSCLPVVLFADNEPAGGLEEVNGQGLESLILKPVGPTEMEDAMVMLLFKGLKPSTFDLHLQAAGEAMASRVFERAHQELAAAEVLKPRRPLINYFRRLVYEAEGRPDLAEKALAKAREIFTNVITGPRQADRQFELGIEHLADGRLQEAKEAFDRIKDLDPDNQDRPVEIGEAFLTRGMPREAEPFFRNSLENNPEDIHLYNRLGIAYRRQNKLDEAIANYLMAIDIDPHEENLRYNLARAYLSAGDRESAARALEKAVEINPEFKEARTLLERLTRLLDKK